jgi:SHS2 domain-containing protein
MKKFSILGHPSDTGLAVYGKTIEELFENAALGMFSLITDLEQVAPKEEFKITSYGDDSESLLVACLNDFIFLHETKKVVLCRFELKTIGNNKAQFRCRGERFNPVKHNLLRSIKAATFNQLKISRDKAGYSAKVVFDV